MTPAKLAAYNLFEYEHRLSERELKSLSLHAAKTGQDPGVVLHERATYFHTVNDRATLQAVTEDAHHAERGSRGSRQATRYLVHGLHEYKGKFNPQMARALVNAIDPDATALMDPYCGSGTTLIEGMRLGMSVAGIDHNPLAVWLSQVKVATHRLSGQDGLVTEFDKITGRILLAMKEAQDSEVATAPAHVDGSDASYLHRWFPEPVLAALWAGLTKCREADHPVANVAALCISNIVRQVSWQLPEDLRVRRRPADWTPPSVAEVFATVAERGRLALVETEQAPPVPEEVTATVHPGSSREQDLVSAAWPQGRRLVVTSPPYATALPYIDTDRLSIVLLGLAHSSEIRRLEQQLTGSREWRTSEAARWERAWRDNSSALPDGVLSLLGQIERNNGLTNAGFRRQAVPALLYRYFTQIGETLSALGRSMQPGEHVVMVVGGNRTGSGAHQTVIPTPELIGQLSTTRGFDYSELIPLQTWARYGMHAKNAVSTEDAVVMTVTG